MRTTLIINDTLLAEAMKWAGSSTKTAAINEALRLMTHVKKRERLIELAGKVKLSVDTDITRNRNEIYCR
jgi:Arc/MetJ family transcription regulator